MTFKTKEVEVEGGETPKTNTWVVGKKSGRWERAEYHEMDIEPGELIARTYFGKERNGGV